MERESELLLNPSLHPKRAPPAVALGRTQALSGSNLESREAAVSLKQQFGPAVNQYLTASARC